MRRHGALSARYAVPDDDIELANVGADLGFAVRMEAVTCVECDRCAGCISLVTDCGHAPCVCEVRT